MKTANYRKDIDFESLVKYAYGELTVEEAKDLKIRITTELGMGDAFEGICKIKNKERFATSNEHFVWLNDRRFRFDLFLQEKLEKKSRVEKKKTDSRRRGQASS